ncbi:MAG: hypothetical protein KDA69_13535 [Planctomycetaceae bacterium]|nr:hypothetical protein [Planctomycetaceae bacterium]MCA9045343.1 hypothetical protein [Planctomycetaceae bacterium]MCB9953196.1 hypothetical protein [Planctomycetaceae bacterium]
MVFGWFGKDWNVLAVMIERMDLYKVNGQRVSGGAATKARDGAKSHPRTLLWLVFNQKGSLIESGPGPAVTQIPAETFKQLEKDIRINRTVLEILKSLETGESKNLAKPLVWMGYPRKPRHGGDD